MTTHIYHEDSHTHGLFPGCPRCQEHAEHPERGLDSENTERLLRGDILSTLDRIARENLLAYRESA